MTIKDIITKHYEKLYAGCDKKDTVISCNKTQEDVFQDVMLTAINKYKGRELSEEEGLAYLRKSLNMEYFFQYKKVDNREVSLDDFKCPPVDDLFE